MFVKAFLVGALATLAAAQSSVLSFTRVPNPVTAGQPQAITYSTNDTSSPVTILLRKGSSNNLQTVSILTQSAIGGQYIWTPASNLETASDYALQITQGDQANYYGPFSVQGGTGMASSSSSGSMSMTSSMASSSSGAVIGGMSMSSSRNASGITSAPMSAGTGASMSRNQTMSSATLSNSMTSRPAASTSSAGGAGFQSGSSTTSAPAGSTGGASGITTAGSAVALVFGAAAAVLFA